MTGLRQNRAPLKPALCAAWLLLCAAAGAPAAAGGDLAREMLAAHNAVRAKLLLPPMVWSAKLAGVAQNWATTLLMQSAFLHRPQNAYGENMFEIRGGAEEPADVVYSWASEAAYYDRRLNLCRIKGLCGHYTQIVWRETRQVGCAVARSSTREVWVCNYSPPGNIRGRRPY